MFGNSQSYGQPQIDYNKLPSDDYENWLPVAAYLSANNYFGIGANKREQSTLQQPPMQPPIQQPLQPQDYMQAQMNMPNYQQNILGMANVPGLQNQLNQFPGIGANYGSNALQTGLLAQNNILSKMGLG